jgi:hypothetical protein
MRHAAAMNSTNVRAVLQREGAGAALAWVLWGALVASLAWSGTLEVLEDDLPALYAATAFFAALAYAADAELRQCIDGQDPGTTLFALVLSLCFMRISGASGILVALAPATVLSAALVRRAVRRRASSAPATSPGARRAAP